MQDLSYRFDVSQSTVSRVFLSRMTVMDVRLTPLIAWSESEELWCIRCLNVSNSSLEKTNKQTKQKTTTTAITIDCFEIVTERP